MPELEPLVDRPDAEDPDDVGRPVRFPGRLVGRLAANAARLAAFVGTGAGRLSVAVLAGCLFFGEGVLALLPLWRFRVDRDQLDDVQLLEGRNLYFFQKFLQP